MQLVADLEAALVARHPKGPLELNHWEVVCPATFLLWVRQCWASDSGDAYCLAVASHRVKVILEAAGRPVKTRKGEVDANADRALPAMQRLL